MNAERVCKLRNGVKKTPKFLLFSMAKVNQVRNEYSPQLSKLMAYLTIGKQEALSHFKGLSLDGGRSDFSKNLPRRFL